MCYLAIFTKKLDYGGGVEKCEDRKYFNFLPFCLVGSRKVEE